MSLIEKFTIMGERNTGTHFLQYALLRNFKLDYVRNIKHFFGHEEPLNDSNLLTICVVRNPIDWIDSFFKRLHHIPPENKKNIEAFLFNEFYSIYETEENKGNEIMEDRNYITGERYKNIFEMRKFKNDYFLNIINKKVKNIYILKYEDLRDDYDNTLNKLKNKFNLVPWNHNNYVKIEKYKGTFNALYSLKPILISDDIQKKIIECIDKEQEKLLGYEFNLL
jgi:hypothetical protein